jgi:predicted anti-sigma-YlaC factor YlaD
VNQHSDIRLLFLPWAEQQLTQQLAQQVEGHLRECSACRKYYDTMSAALLSEMTMRSRLVPDLYLPTRIRARAKESRFVSPSGNDTLVRWSLRVVAFAAAVVAGLYMGEKLAYEPSVVTDQHIITEYSNYLGESGIGERWQTVALTSEAVSK